MSFQPSNEPPRVIPLADAPAAPSFESPQPDAAGLAQGKAPEAQPAFVRDPLNTLKYQATIDDSTVFTKPWTIELAMNRSEGSLFEVACHEGNYGMANILSGHRAEERKK